MLNGTILVCGADVLLGGVVRLLEWHLRSSVPRRSSAVFVLNSGVCLCCWLEEVHLVSVEDMQLAILLCDLLSQDVMSG